MTAIDGFRLEFHDGTVFRATENVRIEHQPRPLYLVDGLQNLVRLYNTYINDGGQPGRADSNFSTLKLGFGAGIHTIQIQFLQYEGNSENWGDASSGDSAITKLNALNRAITTTQADSGLPALLEVGEYNDPSNHSGVSSSLYSPIPVALGENNSLQYDQSENVSDFSGTLTFIDVVDVSQAVDAILRTP